MHGAVLNLYLNGEQYPHLVDDYFPIAAAGDTALAATMRTHVQEEDKHVALYTKAIKSLEQPVRKLELADIFNTIVRKHTPVSFRMQDGDSPEQKNLKLAHFLAHAHFLEARVARSLEYHLEACVGASSPYVEKAVSVVLADEYKHVQYTRTAVFDLLPRAQAEQVMALHGTAEKRANLDFSANQLRRLTTNPDVRLSARSALLYRACASLMGVFVHHG